MYSQIYNSDRAGKPRTPRVQTLWLGLALLGYLASAFDPAIGQVVDVPASAPLNVAKPADKPTGDSAQPIQTLLLRNGEMIRGRITADSETFLVLPTEGGRIKLPRNQVALLCADANEAYRHLASRVPAADTAAREKLVEWCLHHDLLEFAEFELRQLAKMSRRVDDIEALQRRLTMKQESRRTPTPKVQTAAYQRSVRREAPTSHVTPESLAMFTRKVQPLLSNGCAAANCHGRATITDFRLNEPPRGFSFTKRLTQKNLAATLRQLDIVSPGDSPLLKMAQSPHGNAKAVYGLNQTRAYGQILTWVETVTGPIEPPTSVTIATPVKPVAPGPTARPPGGEVEKELILGGVTPRTITEEEAALTLDSLGDVEPAGRKPANVREGKDPFDADVFNATYGT